MYSPDPASNRTLSFSVRKPEKFLFVVTAVPFSVIRSADLTGSLITAVVFTGMLTVTSIFEFFLSHPDLMVPYELSNEALEYSSLFVGCG
jgi:hypothetical protein